MLVHSRADFRIAVRAVPVVAVVVLAKLAVDQLDWDRVELNTLYSGFVAANVFLIGFLLAGTLADYKESERLPGELAGRTKAIADECVILHRAKHAAPARACLAHLERLATGLEAWLRGRADVDRPLDDLDGLNHYFLAFESLTQPNFIVRLKQEQSALRLLVIRINTIKETSFVGAGYVIAEATSALLLLALLIADVAQLPAELFLVGAIAFLLTYMILLIRDMDNPFDFHAAGKRGAVEVSLAPLEQLEASLARDLASLNEDQAPEEAR
jgi:hypothetical protein